MQKTVIFLIKSYRLLISPLLGRRCRFYPSCSEFMLQAVEKQGIKGVLTGLKRLAKCHPFNQGGVDPLEKWIN